MKNREEILNCFTAIKNNIITSHQLDNELYSPVEFNSWCEILKKRSLNIKEIHKHNQKTILIILDYLSKDLNDEIADALYEGYRSLEEREIHDSYFIIDVINKLVPYYEEKKDYVKLIHLYTDRCYETGTFLRLGKEDLARLKNDLYRIISFKEYYESFTNAKERRLIFVAYYNIIRSLPDYDERYSEDIIPIFKEAKSFYHSLPVRNMKDQELARNESNLLNIMFLHSFMYYLDEGLSQQMEYVDLIDEIKDTFEDEMDTDLCNAVLNYFHDQMNDTEFVYYLKRYFDFYHEEANKITFTENSDFIFIESENMFNTAYMIYDFLRHSYIPYKEKREKACYVTQSIVDFVKKIPHAKYNVFFDEACGLTLRKALPFLATPDRKEKLLTDIVLKKQILNYVHSRMVERICLAILDSIQRNNDLMLQDFIHIGFYDYNDLRGYVARAARIHDLGKSLSLGLINQQIRGLSETEYKYIRLHPALGDEFTDRDVDFDYYHDVMLGHHKSYDGKSGYPLDFDNTTSKYKLIIDLISIADSIDAGTDLYGRNYHEGKNFDMVLAELVKGEGTQYNPNLVEFIWKNNDLLEELRYVVNDGRLALYYDTYVK